MLKLKVCGVNDVQNFRKVCSLAPDFIGLNFYKKSPRYAGEERGFEKHQDVRLAGIFVNEEVKNILDVASKYKLDYLQLHGSESPEDCMELNRNGAKVIKAFAVGDDFDFETTSSYIPYCDYFLFDTAGSKPGGTGRMFNWQILDYYPFQKPYFLAGGISPENVEKIFRHRFPQLYAIDVNSGYEVSPGVKDIEKLKGLQNLIRLHNGY